VIDAGCYDGRLYHYLEQLRLFPRYVGIDARQDYLETAARKIGSGRARFVARDLSADYGGARDDWMCGDVVICLEVLEHMDRDRAYVALMNLFRLARPEGLVVVGTPVNYADRAFHNVEREGSLGHHNFLVHEEVVEFTTPLGDLVAESSGPGYSLKSSYRIPSDLPEPWRTMRVRLGPAFRPIYLSCMSEPNGGYFYVWRRREYD